MTTTGRTLPPRSRAARPQVCATPRRSQRMNSEIAEIVEKTYRAHIGLPATWSPGQQQAFLDQQTTRLSTLVAQLAAELGEAATASWTQRAGHAPDYPTTAGLLNAALVQAREVVLTEELYSQIPPEPEPTDELPASDSPDEVDWGNPHRWRTPRRSEPTDQVTALVARLWPDRSDWFTIKAEYLLQTRSEDGQPLPSSPGSALTRYLARLVEDDLAGDGLPLR